jgi:hypothetical protein
MNDFHAERRRLKAAIAEKESLMKADVDSLKQTLKPVNMAINYVAKFTSSKDKDSPLNKGVESAVTYLLRNVVLARAGWITKIVVPIIARNYASNKLTENKADIVHTVREWLHKFQEKRRAKMNGHYDKSTADINI